jgi:FMN phosphatase YigB (HAD superfamily)
MALWPEVHAIAGAREMLEALAPRYRIAIATNASVSDGPLVLRALERASLREHVSAVFCSNEIGSRKDVRRFWEVVGSVLGVGLESIVMLGDSLEQDVLAPRRFGVTSVWFDPDDAPLPLGVDVPVVRRLADFPRLLETGLAPRD